ncbi:MAG TPA: hypothetical protein VGD65_22220 [Chryseosolibacter sp.]
MTKNYLHRATFLLYNLVAVVTLLSGCRATQTADDYVRFEDKETGWSTLYPASWEVVPDAEAAAIDARGQKKIEATVARKIDDVHTRLLWIRKGRRDSFNSNKMVYKFATAEAYNANILKIYDVMMKTYELQGVRADFKKGTMMINGLEFNTLEITVYEKGTNRVAGYQLMCTRYINKRIGLLMNLNYTNEKNKQILMNILVASKFTIRD